MFGPDYARALVDRDLTTIEELIAVTPAELRSEVRWAAGRIAELGGWIAQDSGDPVKAGQLTRRAEDHVRSADPTLRAMVSMRRSNILLASDPALAVELAADAARLIERRSVGRLAVSIARQRALAAIADHDRIGFVAHSAHAFEIAQIDPLADDYAVYATPAYVAAEIASGFIAINQPAKALDLLLEHQWPADQRRDHAVACARLLRTFIVLGDYRAAVEHVDAAIRGYLVAPSDGTRRELRYCRRIIRDRSRADKKLPLLTPRRRIEAALQGDIEL